MNNEDKSWLDHRAGFADDYHESNYISPLLSYVMHASHRLAEKNFHEGDHFSKVLEVGVGSGEHLPFIRHGFDQYTLTDLDALMLEVAQTCGACQRVATMSACITCVHFYQVRWPQYSRKGETS